MRILSLIFAFIGFVKCANILGIFPMPSRSHQIVYHALMKELAARGHQLTILTTDRMELDNSNVTQIVHHNSYAIFRQFNFVEFKEKKMTEIDLIQVIYDMQIRYVDDQLSHPEVKNLIINSDKYKFDVIIFEHLHHLTYLAFAELYDCPVISISSLDTSNQVHDYFGNEVNPILHPEFFFPYENGKLSFTERWNSLKYYLTLRFFIEPSQNTKAGSLVKKHFPTVKSSVEDLQKRSHILMTNTHPAMGFIRPILPNTIQLGFLHIEPPKELPQGELKTFLDSSNNGVIYMSLGTNVQSKDLNPDILNSIVQAFASLSYNVVWKYEAETLPNKPDNVMISKWLPQADLLGHPKIKLFITHGGQQSMEESIDRMVPMIVIPFLSDQSLNAGKMEQRGIGCRLEYLSITKEKLIAKINEMLKQEYKQNIRKLRNLVNDQPLTSREKAVWWTEYVIRNKGAKHLNYPGNSVPFYQRAWLDFITIFIVAVTVTVKVVTMIVRKIICSAKIKSD